MLDRERILAKIDVLDGYLRELRTIAPATFEAYTTIEKRRACERLLQVSIECVIDISSLLVIGLRLGLPAEEDPAQVVLCSHPMSVQRNDRFRETDRSCIAVLGC
jgi:uncharacterized protein YutE (UPF0331/DUF86 family)